MKNIRQYFHIHFLMFSLLFSLSGCVDFNEDPPVMFIVGKENYQGPIMLRTDGDYGRIVFQDGNMYLYLDHNGQVTLNDEAAAFMRSFHDTMYFAEHRPSNHYKLASAYDQHEGFRRLDGLTIEREAVVAEAFHFGAIEQYKYYIDLLDDGNVPLVNVRSPVQY